MFIPLSIRYIYYYIIFEINWQIKSEADDTDRNLQVKLISREQTDKAKVTKLKQPKDKQQALCRSNE